MLDRTD